MAVGGLGDAYINVHANTKPFNRELDEKLAVAAADADQMLDGIGKDWGDHLAKSTSDELGRHGHDFARAIEDSTVHEEINVRSKVNYHNIRDEKGRFAKRIAQGLESEIEDAFEKATAPGGPFDKIGRGIADAIGSGFNISGKSPLIIALIPVVGAIVGLVIVASQAINVLAGALVALPGLLTAIGFQVGVVMLAFHGLGTAISGAFAAKNAQELNAALKGLTPQAAAFVRGLLPLKDFFTSLQKVVQSNFFHQFGQAIPMVLNALGPRFFQGMAGLASAMGAAFRTLLLVFQNTAFKFFISDVFARTVYWLQKFTPQLGHFITSLIYLADAALPFLTGLGIWLGNNIDALATFFDMSVKGGGFAQWLNGLGPTLDKLGELISKIISFVGVLVFQLDKAGANKVIDAFSDAFEQLAFFLASPAGEKALVGLVNLSIGSIKVLTGLLELILGVVGGLEAFAEYLKNNFAKDVADILTNIGRWVTYPFVQIGHFFIWLGQKLQEAWDKITGGVKQGVGYVRDKISDAIGYFNSLPTRIVKAVGNLGDTLYKAGSNLIGGLLRGIRDHIPGLKSLLGWIGDHLPDWKGPEDKDRRILEPAGKAVMSGFITGINSGAAELRDALTGITQRMSGTGTSTTNSQAVNFGPGAISISFMGDPTPEQAYQVGSAVGAGINNQIAMRNVALGVRRM